MPIGCGNAVWKVPLQRTVGGQRYGLVIAVAGLAAAVAIAPFSAVAAGIIGTLDLFGMVALFVAPRILERMRSNGTPLAE